MDKVFYLISVDKQEAENSKKDSIGKKMVESWLDSVQAEKQLNVKVVNISDPDMGILLDALYGQILGIEKDCKKLGKKIATVCNDFKC